MSEKEINEIIARNINMYLEHSGKTQVDLADYMNVSQATISNWCKGAKMPRMDKIDKICSFFSIKRTDLMDEHISSPTPSLHDLIISEYGTIVSDAITLFVQLDAVDQGSILERMRVFLEQDKYSRQKGVLDA